MDGQYGTLIAEVVSANPIHPHCYDLVGSPEREAEVSAIVFLGSLCSCVQCDDLKCVVKSCGDVWFCFLLRCCFVIYVVKRYMVGYHADKLRVCPVTRSDQILFRSVPTTHHISGCAQTHQVRRDSFSNEAGTASSHSIAPATRKFLLQTSGDTGL